MKTARFAEVVKRSGAPEVYALWVAPDRDRTFQAAVKAHRVMTIHQANVGAKKDYGEVGFHKDATAQYLIFPKSLQPFADRHVVGINYDLLKGGTQLAPAGSLKKAERRPVPAKAGPRARREKPPVSATSAPPAAKTEVIAFPTETTPAPQTAAPEPQHAPPPRVREAKRPTRRSDARTPTKAAARDETAATKRSAPETKLVPAAPQPPEVVLQELVVQVKRALKELKAGKAVAAYQRLQQAADTADAK